MPAFTAQPHRRFSFQNRRPFLWPVFLAVAAVHAALFAFALTRFFSPPAAVTRPITGFLISPPSQANAIAPSTGTSDKKHNKNTKEINKKQNVINQTSQDTKIKNLPSSPQKDAIFSHSQSQIPAKTNGQNSGETNQNGMNAGTFFSPRLTGMNAQNPKPIYPLASRRMGEEGTVILSVHILHTGQVDEVRLKQSSGYLRLDQAAIASVKKWRYTPAKKDNVPISCWHLQPVTFSLTD